MEAVSRVRAAARAASSAAAVERAATAEAEAAVLTSRRRLVQLARLSREALSVIDANWGSGGSGGGGGALAEALLALSAEPEVPIEDSSLPYAVAAPIRSRARLAAAADGGVGSGRVGGARASAALPSAAKKHTATHTNDDTALLTAVGAISARLEEFVRSELARQRRT
jgi:hypothetical protein